MISKSAAIGIIPVIRFFMSTSSLIKLIEFIGFVEFLGFIE